MTSLPGYPQAGLFVKLHPEDVAGLIDNSYLRMNLLDFILHLTCIYSSDICDFNYCLGGTGPIRGVKKQEKFEKLCQQLEGFEKGKH